MFLQGLNYDISQALPWRNHALSTLERKCGDPGVETANVASGKDVEEMSEAKSRGGVWRGHGLSESIWAR